MSEENKRGPRDIVKGLIQGLSKSEQENERLQKQLEEERKKSDRLEAQVQDYEKRLTESQFMERHSQKFDKARIGEDGDPGEWVDPNSTPEAFRKAKAAMKEMVEKEEQEKSAEELMEAELEPTSSMELTPFVQDSQDEFPFNPNNTLSGMVDSVIGTTTANMHTQDVMTNKQYVHIVYEWDPDKGEEKVRGFGKPGGYQLISMKIWEGDELINAIRDKRGQERIMKPKSTLDQILRKALAIPGRKPKVTPEKVRDCETKDDDVMLTYKHVEGMAHFLDLGFIDRDVMNDDVAGEPAVKRGYILIIPEEYEAAKLTAEWHRKTGVFLAKEHVELMFPEKDWDLQEDDVEVLAENEEQRDEYRKFMHTQRLARPKRFKKVEGSLEEEEDEDDLPRLSAIDLKGLKVDENSYAWWFSKQGYMGYQLQDQSEVESLLHKHYAGIQLMTDSLYNKLERLVEFTGELPSIFDEGSTAAVDDLVKVFHGMAGQDHYVVWGMKDLSEGHGSHEDKVSDGFFILSDEYLDVEGDHLIWCFEKAHEVFPQQLGHALRNYKGSNSLYKGFSEGAEEEKMQEEDSKDLGMSIETSELEVQFKGVDAEGQVYNHPTQPPRPPETIEAITFAADLSNKGANAPKEPPLTDQFKKEGVEVTAPDAEPLPDYEAIPVGAKPEDVFPPVPDDAKGSVIPTSPEYVEQVMTLKDMCETPQDGVGKFGTQQLTDSDQDRIEGSDLEEIRAKNSDEKQIVEAAKQMTPPRGLESQEQSGGNGVTIPLESSSEGESYEIAPKAPSPFDSVQAPSAQLTLVDSESDLESRVNEAVPASEAATQELPNSARAQAQQDHTVYSEEFKIRYEEVLERLSGVYDMSREDLIEYIAEYAETRQQEEDALNAEIIALKALNEEYESKITGYEQDLEAAEAQYGVLEQRTTLAKIANDRRMGDLEDDFRDKAIKLKAEHDRNLERMRKEERKTLFAKYPNREPSWKQTAANWIIYAFGVGAAASAIANYYNHQDYKAKHPPVVAPADSDGK